MARHFRNISAAIAVFGAFCSISVGHAADLPGRSNGSTPIFARNWGGFYVGGHLGYGFGRSRGAEIDGFSWGAQAGFNLQSNSVVFGGEADLSYSGADYRGFAETFRQKWLFSGRARLGYAFDRFMPFVTAGLAYTTATMKSGGAKSSNGHIGYVLGIGGEMMITQNVSASLQYLHYRFGSETYNVLPLSRNANIITNEIRAGINYRF